MGQGTLASRSLKNSGVALTMYFVNLLLQFYSRKVFLDYLGTEILGLNTTATNILNLFNLAEMGISNAVAFSLYKPLLNNETKRIKDIVALQGKFFKYVASIILLFSIIVMAFFPIIFNKMTLPLWYAYASFGVLLLSSLLGYFINYKQIVLSADLKDYKIQLSYKLVNFIKLVIQIIVIKHTEYPYIWWLIIEAAFALISAGSLNIAVYRTYPYLKNYKSATFSELNRQYPHILNKTKQLFFHKISGVSLFQIAPLLIYGFFTLSMVTMFYNYMIVVMGVISISVALFNSVGYGVGNLIAKGDNNHTIKVFYELYSIRFILISTMCSCVYIGYQSFIKLWIGEEFLLSQTSVILFTSILYLYLSRNIVFDFINGFGYYDDVWAAIAEIGINAIFSFILGKYFGLNGILTGILISLICISTIWKPIYILKIKLKTNITNYITTFIKLNSIGLVTLYLSVIIINTIFINNIGSWKEFLFKIIISAIIYLILTSVIIYICDKNYRKFIKRFI